MLGPARNLRRRQGGILSTASRMFGPGHSSMPCTGPDARSYHTYIVSRCLYGCKCLNSCTRRQQGGCHPHPNQQMSR